MRARRAPADPAFAAELEAIAAARRDRVGRHVGTGLPVGKNGEPEPVDPDGPFVRNNHVLAGWPPAASESELRALDGNR